MNLEPDRQQRLLEAAELGYKTTGGGRSLKHFAPERPLIRDHVMRVLGDHDDLGRILYSYTSAISHGTLGGLVERVEPPDRRGPVVAGIAITSTNIGMAAALVMAHARAQGGL